MPDLSQLFSFSGVIPAMVVVLLLLAWAAFYIMSLRVVVPTNTTHIVQRGEKTTEYGNGREGGNVYYRWPEHIPVIGLRVREMPETIIQLNLKDYEAYDQHRLPFVVDVAAFFRVENAALVAQRVLNMDELKVQLTAILQGAIRSILAQYPLEKIMEERSIFSEHFTTEVAGQLKEWGVVTTKPIELMDLRDAKGDRVIANIMAKEQSRIEKESRVVVAANNQEAQLKEIDAQRNVELQKQEAQQQVGIRNAQREQQVGVAAEVAKQEVIQQARTTTEREMEVKRVSETKAAEIAKAVASVKAQQNQEVQTIQAETDKKVQITQADARKQAFITEAEGKKESALLEATGIKSIGEANAAAQEALLMAPVNAQIAQAREIGQNQEYQQYLITIRQIEAQQAIGMESAGALKGADLKIIANSNDIQGGMTKLLDIASPAGGANLAGMMANLAQTEEGQALVNKLTSNFLNK